MPNYQPRLSDRQYPATAAECIDDSLRYQRATLQALADFRACRPWRGTMAERMEKFRRLHAELCRIYGTDPLLGFDSLNERFCSGGSYYMPSTHSIQLSGRLSVVTYLHEFAHALGRGERGAVRWSLNLFKRTFPRSFARLEFEGHVARRM